MWVHVTLLLVMPVYRHSLFLFEYTVRVSKCVSNSELDYLWELLISMRTVTSGLFSSYRECSLFRSVATSSVLLVLAYILRHVWNVSRQPFQCSLVIK